MMASEASPDTPRTPGKVGNSNKILDAKISLLNSAWPLKLQPKGDGAYTPSKQRTPEDHCLWLIKFCSHKRVVDEAIREFHVQADILWTEWVSKPLTDRGHVPQATRSMPRPVSEEERDKLLRCLINILDTRSKPFRDAEILRSPLSSHSGGKSSLRTSFISKPVPFSFPPRQNGETKRTHEKPFLDISPAKKAKGQDECTCKDMPPPDAPARLFRRDGETSRSTSTSFAASETSTVFSNPSFQISTRRSTQETIPDDKIPHPSEKEERSTSTISQENKDKNSNFGDPGRFDGNICNLEITENLISSPEEVEFRRNLDCIFPEILSSLKTKKSLSIYAIYEITRVFLHAGVSLKEFNVPVSENLQDYDTLWKVLKRQTSLQGLPFPEPCGEAVWALAHEDSKHSVYLPVFSGSLHFGTGNDSKFRLRLDPLKLDQTHRLGRRLGNERFLEISMPSLLDKQLPPAITKLGLRGRQIFYDWLIDCPHDILGMKWHPFFVKPKERKSKERKSKKREDGKPAEAEAAFRVYFFAVSGHGSLHALNIANECNKTAQVQSIPALLNMVRPTVENKKGSFLKLFSRTSLALSRNRNTVVLSKDQIRFQSTDILCNGIIMNDGAGRISYKLADQVRLSLGLTYIPAVFQGRLGEAKGLWVVDGSGDFQTDWIEIYPSQQKWMRDSRSDHSGISDDWSHRTFEVLKWSGPLKPADLNTQFLPLLVEQAIDRKLMKSSIVNILQDGLATEVKTLRDAIKNPQFLRKWVRAAKFNPEEKLRHGAVQYRAGMPTSTDEQINMLLDAGFSPMSLRYLYDLAKSIFTSHCDNLKERLNITVAKSTYAYMVPDFWGVLEPDEVYISFSRFNDGFSEFSGALRNGIEVLVARSPAHFISDIQKVKVVVKAELIGLHDVIVFPTKGILSLASKLSGGDYDGDIAWVCWEDNIVKNFRAVEVAQPKDLVKEGLLTKDSTTYEQLVEGCVTPISETSVFLKKAFDFNMRQSMLGICTNFKERVCYTQKSVNTPEAQYLSQLLSDLVDAAKQGFIFDEEAFQRFKTARINITTIEPKYITGDLGGDTSHILDHLMVVTDNIIRESLEQLWEGFRMPNSFDDDLVLLSRTAKEYASGDENWNDLLKHVVVHLNNLKDKWSAYWNTSEEVKNERLANFSAFIIECYEDFKAIRPHVKTSFTQALLLSPSSTDELSQWALLKASIFVDLYPRSYVPNAVFWIVGRQLARIKADVARNGLPHVIVPNMFIIQKPDNAIIGRLLSHGSSTMIEETGSIKNAEELEDPSDG